MTYALAWPLQKAIYELLSATPTLVSMVGDRIHDGAPQERVPGVENGLSVVIGDDAAQDWSSSDGNGAQHLIGVAIIARERSFADAKAAAAAISDALLHEAISLERGRVVHVAFHSARTKREERDALRRIEMRFRVLVEDSL